MCGLVGAFKPRGECTSDVLIATMRDRMVHRGPDGAGLWRSPDGDCSFGHRRLSIIDLSDAASQPMLNQRRHGFARLQRRDLQPCRGPPRARDPEQIHVADRSLRHRGAASCLRGMGPRLLPQVLRHVGRRHLRRPRPGQARASTSSATGSAIKPLYFTRTTIGEWLFASEIRALLAHPACIGRDGPARLLALSHLHRRAGAADDVSRHLQAAAGHDGDDRSHRPRDLAALLGLQALGRADRSRRRI